MSLFFGFVVRGLSPVGGELRDDQSKSPVVKESPTLPQQ